MKLICKQMSVNISSPGMTMSNVKQIQMSFAWDCVALEK